MNSIKKLKILFLASYSITDVHDIFKKGLLPDHLLFGIPELERECNMEILIPSFRQNSILNRVGSWFDLALIEQEIKAIFMLPKCDIVYAPFASTNTKLIIFCKLIGLIRKPVVVLVHDCLFGKPSKYKLVRTLVKKLILKYDTIIFLSKKMRTELVKTYSVDEAHADEHFIVSCWGANLDYFRKYSTPNVSKEGAFIMSSGHSGRDFDIVIRASRKINFPFRIYCRPGSYPKSALIPKNVEIFSGTFPFEKICKDYANASIILIPLSPNPQGTVGFSSLLEAMAMGKPVIMTSNENIDVDLQTENMGIVVAENDVDAWVDAMSSLLNNHVLLKEMGANSLRLGTEKFNVNIFAKHLAKVLYHTHDRYTSALTKLGRALLVALSAALVFLR